MSVETREGRPAWGAERRPDNGLRAVVDASIVADPASSRLSKIGRFDTDDFVRRVLQDCFQQALAAYWRRRADTFAWVGNDDCDRIAQACRARAEIIEQYGPGDEIATEIDRVLGEVV